MSILLNNRYRVLRTIGDGGFGQTFLAEDIHMPSRRCCAIKQLKPITEGDRVEQLVRSRFAKEAAILENLGEHHAQIPRLYAYFNEHGKYYLVQEWIEGETLRNLVINQGKIAEDLVTHILVNILSILKYVHARGIVHRDIKPDNIILRDRDNLPVLIDFGAVKETMGTTVAGRSQATTSIVIGSPGFMPPEQAAGRPIYSSDLYALGLVGIYLLTAKSPQELPTDSRTGEIIWRDCAQKVSPHLVEVLSKAIMSHPRDRFMDAASMLNALHGNSDRTVIKATRLPPENNSRYSTVAVVPPTHATKELSSQGTSRQKRQRLPVSLLLILVSLAIGSITAFGLWNRTSSLPDDTDISTDSTLDTSDRPTQITDDGDRNSSTSDRNANDGDRLIAKPQEATQTLRDYYEHLDRAEYFAAWNMLSPQARQDLQRHPQGYDSYLDWWTKVPSVKLISVNLVDGNSTEAIVDSQIEYELKSRRTLQQNLRFYLLWDATGEQWLLDEVEKLSEQPISPARANSPIDFVRAHYAAIDRREYEATWKNLAPDFQHNKLKNNYQTYVNWWESVKQVKVKSIQLIDRSDRNATLRAKIEYNMKSGKVSVDNLRILLNWNSETNNWMFKDTQNINSQNN